MNLVFVVIVFVLMEGATWLIHKYVMHGFLWVIHRDHHDHSNEGPLERNDLFFLIFSIPAIILLYYGLQHDYSLHFYAGLGITFYGVAYFLVHDIIIHQRSKLFTRTRNRYLLSLRRAHKQHHKHVSKEDGECFGFLWIPLKYFRMYFKQPKL